MYFMSPTSNITPALVSVAMSRSDSRDSHCSSASTTSNFTTSSMTVSYSSSPSSYRLNRTISNTSATSSRRPSSTLSRHDSSQWISSPYKSCQLNSHYDEPSSYLSDDDLLYIAPPTAQPPLPVEHISGPGPILTKKELTTEEQIAMLREMQEKEQQDSLYAQQQRRQSTRRAVRFADTKPRRSSQAQRRTTATAVRKSSIPSN